MRSWLLVLCFAACATHQVEPAPPPRVALPAAFSALGEAPRTDRWWGHFDDAVLSARVERALSHNFDVAAAWARVEQAEALSLAAGATGRPTLQLDAGSSLSALVHAPSGNLLGAPGGEVTQHQAVAGFAWELDLFGKGRAQRAAASLDTLAAVDDVHAAAETVAGGIVAAWCSLAAEAEAERLLDRQLEAAQRVQRAVTLRFGQGSASSADVLQQRQQLAALEAQRPGIQGRRQVLEHQVLTLSGEAAGRLGETPNQLPVLRPLPSLGVPSELLTRRADVRAAFRRVVSADERTAVAVAETLPTFRLSLGLGFSAKALSDLFQQVLVSLGGAMSYAAVDGGRRDAEVERTRAVRAERLAALGRVVSTAFREVEDALANERAAEESVRLIDRQLEHGRAALADAERRFLAGQGDFVQLLSAQLQLMSAESARLAAARSRLISRVQLHQALGGGFSLERGDR